MSALTDLFSNIADAIRYKTGSSSTIVASNFPSEIMDIPSSNDGNQFKQSIAPTHWDTSIQLGLEYSTTDNYGLWRIEASGNDTGDRPARKAFDEPLQISGSDNPTEWVSNDLDSSGEDHATVWMDFPVQIRPQVVTIHSTDNFSGTGGRIAYIYFSTSTSGDNWDLLAQVDDARQAEPKTVAITTSNFYRRMKIVTTKGSNAIKVGYYNIEITQGYWKAV